MLGEEGERRWYHSCVIDSSTARVTAVRMLMLCSSPSQRFNQLSASLSHIVMGKQTPSEVTSIKQLGCWYAPGRTVRWFWCVRISLCVHLPSPFVVSPQWLLDCCTSGEQVSEEKYLCLQLQAPVPSPMPAPRKRWGWMQWLTSCCIHSC